MIKMNSFENKIAVVTGGAKGIGRAVADAFRREGAAVHIIDLLPGDWFVGDVSDKATLERFAESVIRQSDRVDFIVNNALPLMKGIDECSYEEFQYALSVGVTAPFYLTKLLMLCVYPADCTDFPTTAWASSLRLSVTKLPCSDQLPKKASFPFYDVLYWIGTVTVKIGICGGDKWWKPGRTYRNG